MNLNQKSIMAMTAHIIFKSIDAKNVVTHSNKIIKCMNKKEMSLEINLNNGKKRRFLYFQADYKIKEK